MSPVAGLWQIALPAIVVLAVATPIVCGVAALAGDNFAVAAPSLDFPTTELQNMNDISSNLKAKLRGIAEDLVEGKMTEISLHDEGFQFNNHALRAQIIELLNQYVQELSSEEEQVEVGLLSQRVKRKSHGSDRLSALLHPLPYWFFLS